MRAYVLTGPSRFAAVEAAEPVDLPDGHVLVATLAGGICGSDLPLFRGGAAPDPGYSAEHRFGPRRVGFPLHEIVGTVVASAGSLTVGQRVAGWAPRSEGLVERFVVDESSVVAVADDRDHIAQLVVQPLACVLHSLDRVGPVEGRRVAVLGQGPIGALFATMLKARGAAHVTTVDRVDRTAGLPLFDIDQKVIESTDRWAHRLRPAERYDVVIEAIGHHSAPINHAIAATAPEGCVLIFGVIDEATTAVEMQLLQRANLTLVSGTTPVRHRPGALARAAAYATENPNFAAAFVTDVFAASRVQDAYHAAAATVPGRLKVAVDWT